MLKDRQKYTFVNYNKDYPKLFNNEKRILKKKLGEKGLKNIKIEHIGSSAIPSIGGKDIIDIQMEAQKNSFNKITNVLERKGYKRNHTGGSKNRLFFEKNKKLPKKNKEQKFHLHLVENNSEDAKKPKQFKNYLRKNREDARRYSELKKQASKKQLKNKQYRDYKEKFIREIINNKINKNPKNNKQ